MGNISTKSYNKRLSGGKMSKNLSKAELVAQIAEETEMTNKDAGKVLASIIENISDSLINGGSVQLIGFGSFKTTQRAARMGRNPNNGEEIQIPAKSVVKFTAGKKLCEAIEAKAGSSKPKKKGILGFFKKKIRNEK